MLSWFVFIARDFSCFSYKKLTSAIVNEQNKRINKVFIFKVWIGVIRPFKQVIEFCVNELAVCQASLSKCWRLIGLKILTDLKIESKAKSKLKGQNFQAFAYSNDSYSFTVVFSVIKLSISFHETKRLPIILSVPKNVSEINEFMRIWKKYKRIHVYVYIIVLLHV